MHRVSVYRSTTLGVMSAMCFATFGNSASAQTASDRAELDLIGIVVSKCPISSNIKKTASGLLFKLGGACNVDLAVTVMHLPEGEDAVVLHETSTGAVLGMNGSGAFMVPLDEDKLEQINLAHISVTVSRQ